MKRTILVLMGLALAASSGSRSLAAAPALDDKRQEPPKLQGKWQINKE